MLSLLLLTIWKALLLLSRSSLVQLSGLVAVSYRYLSFAIILPSLSQSSVKDAMFQHTLSYRSSISLSVIMKQHI